MKKTLLALGMAATLGTGLIPAAQASATDSSAAQASASGRWQLVDTSSDINGDGTIDGVSLRKKSDKVCQVKVSFGPGDTVQRSLHSSWGNPCRYAGSALFDPRKGAEIKVMTGMGAHTPWDHILTYRDGKLQFQKDADGKRWTIDATVMYTEGYKRVVNRNGKVRLRHDFVNRKDNGVWKGTRKVLAYEHGKWVQVSKSRITRTTKQANALGGWHVRGFKRWM
ncbi:hypothetical protein ASG90_11725 [Nocardioides sp. Soil797]|nr:hypothetical protein ASG90_11725 [Nocardioides sp. Soil797]